MKTKNIKWWYWLIIIIILFAIPFVLNYFILQHQQFEVVGDGTHWLVFWGGYIGSIFGAFVTLYVLQKQIKQNQTENKSNRDLQLDIFKHQQKTQKLNSFREVSAKFINVFEYDNFVVAVNTLHNKCHKNSENNKFQFSQNAEEVYNLTKDTMHQVNEISSIFDLFTLNEKIDTLSEIKMYKDEYFAIVKDIHNVSNRIFNHSGDIDLSSLNGGKYRVSAKLISLITEDDLSNPDCISATVNILRKRYKDAIDIKKNIYDRIIEYIREEEKKIIEKK